MKLKDTRRLAPLNTTIQQEDLKRKFKISVDTTEVDKSIESLQDRIDKLGDSWGDLSDVLTNIKKNQDLIGDSAEDYLDITDAILKNSKSIGTEEYEQLDIQGKINKLLEREQKIKDTVLNATNKEKKLFQSLANLEYSRINAQIEILSALNKANTILETSNDKAKQLGINFQELSGIISNQFTRIFDIFDKVPGLSDVLGLDEVKSSIRDNIQNATIESVKIGGGVASSVFSGLRAGAASIMAAMAPLLPLMISIAAVWGALQVDEAVVKLAKDFNVTKQAAAGLRAQAQGLAHDLEMVGINTQDILDTTLALRNASGLNYLEMSKTNPVAKSMIKNTSLIARTMNMSAEEAANLLVTLSGVTGNSADLLLTAQKYGDELVTAEQILNDIKQVSKLILLSFKGNTTELVLSVKRAKLLGITLDEVAGSVSNLLNIESSLESELKANILLGRQMNLNRARELSLAGDYAGVMDEIVVQMGDINQFEQMNVVQQRALAEALGLSVDKVAEMVAQRKQLNQLGMTDAQLQSKLALSGKERLDELERIRNLRGDEAEALLRQKFIEQDRVSVMEKLSDTGTKLLDAFYTLVTPLLPLINLLADSFVMISNVLMDTIMPVVKEINDVFNQLFPGISGMGIDFAKVGKIIAPLILLPLRGVLFAVEMVKNVVIGIMQTFSGISDILHGDFQKGFASLGKGLVRIILSPIYAAWDLIKSIFSSLSDSADALFGGVDKSAKVSEPKMKQVNDAVINPNGGLVVSGPKGSIQLNSNDSVVAGTNLGKSSGSDNTEVVQLLRELIDKLDQPVQIVLNGQVIDGIEKQTSMRRSYSSKVDKSYGTY